MKISQVPPFGLRMDPELRRQVEAVAREEDRSVNWMVNALLRSALPAWNEQKKQGRVNAA